MSKTDEEGIEDLMKPQTAELVPIRRIITWVRFEGGDLKKAQVWQEMKGQV